MVQRLELIDLEVMRVMTGLRQSPERLLSAQLKLNGVRVRSRRSLQRSLERLERERVLQHDLRAKVWVVDFERAGVWVREAKEQQELRKRLLSNIEDHVLLGGWSGYLWIKKAKGQK